LQAVPKADTTGITDTTDTTDVDSPPRPARLALKDLIRLGLVGPRTRRLRSALSALGIALGIASVVAVTGFSDSDQAHLLAGLDRLGSNMITVGPGMDVHGQTVELPLAAEKMLANVAPVQQVTATGVTNAHVYRNDLIRPGQTNSLTVLAARLNLLDVLHARLRSGRWLDAAAQKLPVAVLGDQAASRLGVDAPGQRVWLGGQWHSVIGILQPDELAPELDTSALVGWPQAVTHLGSDGSASAIYVRAYPERLLDVQAIAGATADPADPNNVTVSIPADLIKARAQTQNTLTGLVLALAGIALLVGGIGIANTMVVGVMERRGEVGVRRALGARSGQIAAQFLIEAVLLGVGGGLAGVAVGALTVLGYATVEGFPAQIPVSALAAGPVTAVVIGAVAGLYPALRAARMSPTEALRSG
jgi:putative ABC transport system permease protein